jgi:hypothetical protein
MGVRNCEEIGVNLQKIMNRLFENENLIKLLYYTDKDPYSHNEIDFKENGFIQKEIYEKLIKIIPRVGPKETANSIIVIKVAGGSTDNNNSEFKNIRIDIETFVPLTQWIIKDDNLRPFAIMGEIQSSLNDKTINGLGKIQGGDFDLVQITDEMSIYRQVFTITEYD